MRLVEVTHNYVSLKIQENCSAGCPCSEFDCIETTSTPEVTTATVPPTTTTPTGNAVLVLSTNKSQNKPFIVDFNGKLRSLFFREIHFIQGNINQDLTFEYADGTESRYGCGATLQNEFWYFGGDTHKRQVGIFNRKIIHSV